MRRLPVLPTLIVAVAVAAMVWLGFWQIRRAHWKEDLLAQYAIAQAMPAVDLDPLLDGRTMLPPLSFRRALVTCHARDVVPEVIAGRSAADLPGQVYYILCRPGAPGLAGRIRINAGWAERPGAATRLTLDGLVAGRLGLVEADGPVTLAAATPAPPLAASEGPNVANIPNNHRFYAVQWFAFAAIALIIYLIALRRRGAPKLPPEP